MKKTPIDTIILYKKFNLKPVISKDRILVNCFEATYLDKLLWICILYVTVNSKEIVVTIEWIL